MFEVLYNQDQWDELEAENKRLREALAELVRLEDMERDEFRAMNFSAYLHAVRKAYGFARKALGVQL